MISSGGVRELRRQLLALDPGKTLLNLLDKIEEHALFAERIERMHKVKMPLRDARAILLNMPTLEADHKVVEDHCNQALQSINKAIDFITLQMQKLIMEKSSNASNGYYPMPKLQQSSEDQDQPVHCNVQPM